MFNFLYISNKNLHKRYTRKKTKIKKESSYLENVIVVVLIKIILLSVCKYFAVKLIIVLGLPYNSYNSLTSLLPKSEVSKWISLYDCNLYTMLLEYCCRWPEIASKNCVPWLVTRHYLFSKHHVINLLCLRNFKTNSYTWVNWLVTRHCLFIYFLMFF